MFKTPRLSVSFGVELSYHVFSALHVQKFSIKLGVKHM